MIEILFYEKCFRISASIRFKRIAYTFDLLPLNRREHVKELNYLVAATDENLMPTAWHHAERNVLSLMSC